MQTVDVLLPKKGSVIPQQDNGNELLDCSVSCSG